MPALQDLVRHPAILESRSLSWPDEAACARFAAKLALQTPVHNAHIELHGPLGAGKTTWVRHLLRALGVQGRIKSPSFAVLEPYAVPTQTGGLLHISHFDFYRFTDPREWADAGFRDMFAAPGLKLCEWPEHAAGLLPLADLHIHIDPQFNDSRDVLLEANTAMGVALLTGISA
jgi:tRNA threonylcarbamoyladenosine biosynthesis protein TsaE